MSKQACLERCGVWAVGCGRARSLLVRGSSPVRHTRRELALEEREVVVGEVHLLAILHEEQRQHTWLGSGVGSGSGLGLGLGLGSGLGPGSGSSQGQG